MERLPRKTIPQEDRGTRAVSHGPSRPPVIRVLVSLDAFGRNGSRDHIEFLHPIPPVPPKEIAVGGVRTIGGGTSKEALRRAKQKAGHNGKH